MPLTTGMRLEDVLVYLQGDLSVSIKHDIYPVLQPNRQEGGYFAVPRLVLCTIDYLGTLYVGWDGKNLRKIATPQKLARYLKEVMYKVDPHYRQMADVLVEMYRHGPVHLNAPSALKSTVDSRTLNWIIFKGPRSSLLAVGPHGQRWATHLEPYESAGAVWHLPLSIDCLYYDLLESIDRYCQMLVEENGKGKDTLIERFRTTADQLVQPKAVNLTW